MARVLWCAVALTALPGCASMRATQQHPPQTPVAEEPAPAPEAAPSADTTPIEPSMDAQTADAGSATAPCTCMDASPKPRPTRPRPKPKPVHKEAPPQLPTAPVVAEAPKGATVDAQVRSMSVSVMSILGKRVQGANGEDLGRVVDVLADDSGRVRIAIIDFGGFLGVGARRIAVDWPLLRFNPDAKDPSLLLSVSREKLQSAPEYKDNPRPQTLMEKPATPPPTAVPATPVVAPDDVKK